MMTLQQLLERSDLSKEVRPAFEKHRLEAFSKAQEVFKDRAQSYNVDHLPYEEMVYGPLSIASELYKRLRRLTALLSPLRKEPLREEDINRILDICIDTINYLTWLYAIVVVASKLTGHIDSDDSPDYLNLRGTGDLGSSGPEDWKARPGAVRDSL